MNSSRMFSRIGLNSRLLFLDKASPCAPSSFFVIQDVGIQSHRLQLWGRWLNFSCPSASWYSVFSLDATISLLLVSRFSLSLLKLMYFRHDFLTSLYTSSQFSSLNLLLCCLSLIDGDKIPFVVKEYC